MVLNSFSFDTITPTSPTTTGLVAWWALENVNDSHTGGYDLTNTGTVTFDAGKISNAATFDGSTQYLSHADAAGLSITGALSLACWIKMDSNPSNSDGMIAKYDYTTNERSYRIGAKSSGVLTGGVSSDGTLANVVEVDSTRTIPLGEWVHVAFTYNPSTSMKLYINGYLKGENITSIPAAIDDNTSDFSIGTLSPAGSGFKYDGQIDDAVIYSKVLTLAEIKWLAAANTFADL